MEVSSTLSNGHKVIHLLCQHLVQLDFAQSSSSSSLQRIAVNRPLVFYHHLRWTSPAGPSPCLKGREAPCRVRVYGTYFESNLGVVTGERTVVAELSHVTFSRSSDLDRAFKSPHYQSTFFYRQPLCTIWR